MRWGGIARFLFAAGLAIALCHSAGLATGENPRRANLNRYQLHDGVQLAGRGLPNHMPDPRDGSDRAPPQPEAIPIRAPATSVSNPLRAHDIELMPV